MSIARRILTAHGTVQGVGFRPFVYQQALALGLRGSVRNCGHGVRIDVEGEPAALDAMMQAVQQQAPPLSRVCGLQVDEAQPAGHADFTILPSELPQDGSATTRVWSPADVAPCVDCRRELADSSDRRSGYPFINCTACGPRFSIVTALPYDRARTSMAPFAMCNACRAEYDTPTSRRFHAEPNACPDCGPRLSYEGPGTREQGASAMASCIEALRRGEIVAIKGVGGFHLACDAENHEAVQRLRDRKRRAARPFALMAPDLDAVRRVADASMDDQQTLSSSHCPIVLLPRCEGTALAPGIAPGMNEVGIMLPPSPLHQILAQRFGGLLVMTSGNLAEEPIATDNQEARHRLAEIADAFLFHDREIVTRLDDSVVRIEDGSPRLLRRARGFVPEPIPLETPRPLIALGADLKSTFCMAGHGLAFVSQHLGDLSGLQARRAYREALSSFSAQLGWKLEAAVCDLHPDYASTRIAESLGLPLLRVQHHHAHAAACLAEHGLSGPVIAVIFDGAGHGEDGAVWGGEFLIADRQRAVRAAHLRYVRLPGGDAAAREPWRMALAHLEDAGEPTAMCAAPDQSRIAPLLRAMKQGIAAPWTSSAGRLFDAVAALCGLCSVGQFEGQAAMLLQAASGECDAPPYPFSFSLSGAFPVEIDVRPMIRSITCDLRAGRAVREIGARFHDTLAAIITETAAALAQQEDIGTVVLSGGCFQNARLAAACTARLVARNLKVLRPRRFPSNDGGISLGQAALAAARMGV